MPKFILLKSSLILLLSLSTSSCSPNQSTKIVYENIKEVEVSFPCTFGDNKGNILNSKAYYSDDYFKEANTKYIPQLGTLSLSLALSSFQSTTDKSSYSLMADNLESFMNQIGMKNFETNSDFINKPTDNSLGVGIGSKRINDFTLIAIGTRGSGYEKEWASNFKVGGDNENEYHQGFYDGSQRILDFLNEYIVKYNLTGNVKIWISGYSRSAACSNIFSGRILLDPSLVSSQVSFSKEDLYSYTFETPRGVIKTSTLNPQDELYSNIYSIISQNDPVTKLAMNSFGYKRFGTDYYTPYTLSNIDASKYLEYRQKMLDFYYELDPIGIEYQVDDLISYDLDLSSEGIISTDDYHINYIPGLIYNTIFPHISNNLIKEKETYISKVQDSLTYTIGTFVSELSLEEINTFIEAFSSEIKEQKINITSFIKNNVEEIYETILPLILSSNENAELNLNCAYVAKAASSLIYAIISTASLYTFEIATLVQSIGSFEPHLPEFVLSWMKGQDPNYYEDENALYNLSTNGGYSILKFNRIGDLNIYDMNNNLIVNVVDGAPVKLENSFVPVGVENGTIVVYLPSGYNYFVEYQGTRSTTVTYTYSNYVDDDNIKTISTNKFDITKNETKKFSI